MGKFYDSVPVSAIVRIRDMMYTVKDPFRLDQGDVSFDAPETFKQAVAKAMVDNRTHYLPDRRHSAAAQGVRREDAEEERHPDRIGRRGARHQRRHARPVCGVSRAARARRRSDRARTRSGRRRWRWSRRRAACRCRCRCARSSAGAGTSTKSKRRSRRRRACCTSTRRTTRRAASSRAATSSGSPPIARERNLWVVSDEAYEDVVYTGEHVSIASLPGMYDRTIPVYTLSKSLRDHRRARRLFRDQGQGAARPRPQDRALHHQQRVVDRAVRRSRRARRLAAVHRGVQARS